MISRIGYKRDLEPASFKRVTIGDSLKAAWGRTQMEVPVEGEWEQLVEGKRRQKAPLPFQPSGLNVSLTNDTLQKWFLASQLATSFYGEMTTTDPEDEKYALIHRQVKDQAAAGEGIGGRNSSFVSGVGEAFIDPGFWAYTRRKQDQEQEVAYKVWKYQQIDAMQPDERAFWMEKCPEFIPQLKLGKKRALKMLSRIADIRINGVGEGRFSAEEDLRFLYNISVGAYQLPEKKKFIPPKETIESDQFPGMTTESNASFPGVKGPLQSGPDVEVMGVPIPGTARPSVGMIGQGARGRPIRTKGGE